ncbi:MerR family transcriptional regulator [Paracoccus versutus]
MSDSEYIGFKEMCARFDVTPRTLRYYEYIELLSPRKEGRSRFYGPREIARMKLILRGRRFGFSLEDIRQWLLIYGEKGTQEQYRVWIELADRQLEVLRQQRDELEASMTELLALRNDTVAILDGMGQDGAGQNGAGQNGAGTAKRG